MDQQLNIGFKLSHRDLCEIGGRFLKTTTFYELKCSYVVVELVSYSQETPDIFGVDGYKSVLIEVKMSKTDFKNDARKKFRKEGNKALGQQRYYLCPEELLNPDEMPKNWGLLYCNSSGKISYIKDATPFPDNERNFYGEMVIIKSILRRLGIKPQVFNFRGF